MTTTRRVGAKTGALNLICQDRGNTRKTRGGEASPKARRRTNMEQSPLEVWENCGRPWCLQQRAILARSGRAGCQAEDWLVHSGTPAVAEEDVRACVPDEPMVTTASESNKLGCGEEPGLASNEKMAATQGRGASRLPGKSQMRLEPEWRAGPRADPGSAGQNQGMSAAAAVSRGEPDDCREACLLDARPKLRDDKFGRHLVAGRWKLVDDGAPPERPVCRAAPVQAGRGQLEASRMRRCLVPRWPEFWSEVPAEVSPIEPQQARL
ncbi:hypothetical protein ACCO45_000238 [Purpureocillium lilacinum]|uniref:Uncharacterized protein n=1 Tax=Purpureocillium lilacinum TaxID=33203 RepID=A0ACC4E522_PURLI